MKGAHNAHTVKSSSTLLRKEATEAVGRLLPLILHLKLWCKAFSKLSLSMRTAFPAQSSSMTKRKRSSVAGSE
jgi:hypothetical protein